MWNLMIHVPYEEERSGRGTGYRKIGAPWQGQQDMRGSSRKRRMGGEDRGAGSDASVGRGEGWV